MADNKEYIYALKYKWFNKLYDPIVQLTTREKRFKEALIKQANIYDGQTVLDVGCGTGTLLIELKKRFPLIKAIGLDGDPAILQQARKKAKLARTDVVFHEGYSNNLPFENESLDKIVSSLFFHHLKRDDKISTLKEIYRTLKKGGELHIADFGKPKNALMLALFTTIRWLDSFETTSDNAKGLIPVHMKSVGFNNVTVTNSFSTIYGTITLYQGVK
ncbi:MAG: class I SAM-dependent methyltransferase [Bacteroidota bacterium]